MAGEWIKLSSNIHTKPEVFKLARLLSQNVDTTVGLLVRFWGWADGVTVDGVVDGVESHDVDAIVMQPGFCDALCAVGWVRRLPSGTGIEIAKFSRHNGESAKKRALKSERQARWRAGTVDAAVDASKTPRRLPEKRREEVKEAPPPDGGPVWTESLTVLTEQGLSERTARSFLGMLCRDFEEAEIAEAVKASVGKADCAAYIRGVLKDRPRKGQKEARRLAI